MTRPFDPKDHSTHVRPAFGCRLCAAQRDGTADFSEYPPNWCRHQPPPDPRILSLPLHPRKKGHR